MSKLTRCNAQNCISRAKCVQQLEAIPELRHLAWHAATVLAPHTVLHDKGEKIGLGEEGVTQGDPEATPYYCVTWHPCVREAEKTLWL